MYSIEELNTNPIFQPPKEWIEDITDIKPTLINFFPHKEKDTDYEKNIEQLNEWNDSLGFEKDDNPYKITINRIFGSIINNLCDEFNDYNIKEEWENNIKNYPKKGLSQNPFCPIDDFVEWFIYEVYRNTHNDYKDQNISNIENLIKKLNDLKCKEYFCGINKRCFRTTIDSDVKYILSTFLYYNPYLNDMVILGTDDRQTTVKKFQKSIPWKMTEEYRGNDYGNGYKFIIIKWNEEYIWRNLLINREYIIKYKKCINIINKSFWNCKTELGRKMYEYRLIKDDLLEYYN